MWRNYDCPVIIKNMTCTKRNMIKVFVTIKGQRPRLKCFELKDLLSNFNKIQLVIKQSIMGILKVDLIIVVIHSSNKLLIIIRILMEINNSEMGISMLSQIIT